MSGNDTVWESSPHTKAKHTILREYLAAWFPILGTSHNRVVYIDGFAGPGVYEGGEDGSPVVALKTAQDHHLRSSFNEIVFWFVESDRRRLSKLEEVLRGRFPDIGNKKGDSTRYFTVNGQFEGSVEKMLDSIESTGYGLAPTFAFLDPFGFTGIPMKTVRRILGYARCEVMVTFMEGFIRRFHDDRRKSALDGLYGTGEWKNIADSGAGADDAYVDLYKKQLENAGAKYVRTFRMIDPHGRTIYHLVYATKHIKGLEAVKRAMRKASQTGGCEFSDRTDARQQVLVDYKDDSVWIPMAAALVYEKFRGARSVPIGLIKEYVLAETPYLFKKSILKEMEGAEPPTIVDVTNRRRAGTHPDGCKISFAA